MAETLGIVASILAILQLTQKLIGYIGDIKEAPEAGQLLQDELKSLSKVLLILQDHCRSDKNLQLSALQSLNGQNGLLTGCATELRRLELKLSPTEGSFGKIKDFFRRGDNEKVFGHISRIQHQKSLFTLALAADQLTLSKEIEEYARDTNLVVHNIQKDLSMESSRTQRQETLRIKLEKRKNALNLLFSDDHDKKHMEISSRREGNTGKWILDHQEFKNWIEGQPGYWILWGYGIPGAGKTFMSSFIVDYLIKDQLLRAGCGVAYFYFDYVERDRQNPVYVLSSLIKQLVNQLSAPKFSPDIEEFLNKLLPSESSQRKTPTLPDLCTALPAVSRSFDRVFLVFDALDECDQNYQRKLLPFVQGLEGHGISVFLTSRPHPEDIQSTLQTAVKIELLAHREDIKVFIQQKISENARAKRLVERGKCGDRIVSDIITCAKGMFLHAHFSIEHICQQTTVGEILTELEVLKNSHPPIGERPLDPTYDRMMETLRGGSGNSIKLALTVLSWLVKAREILTVDGLREAVSVKSGIYRLDELDLHDSKTLLDVCAGFVIIDESSNTIRLAHYTVQEYLLRKCIIFEDTDFKLAVACMTYLSFDIFAQYSHEGEPAQAIHWGNLGRQEFRSAYVASLHLHPFLRYAARNLVFHLSVCDKQTTLEIFLKFLENSGRIDLHRRVDLISSGLMDDTAPSKLSALHFASEIGHYAAVYQLLEDGADNSLRDRDSFTALHYAASNGHKLVVSLLLEKSADYSAIDKNGRTALCHAAMSGHISVVKLLLHKGADCLALDIRGRLALHEAAWAGHKSIVELLLEHGPDHSIEALDEHGHSAIQEAASTGRESVVELLLSKNADHSVLSSDGRSALHEAALGGHESIVKMLLDRDGDCSVLDAGRRSALHEASWRGHHSVVKLLLDNGAECSILDVRGRSPLFEAVTCGHVLVAELLLEKVDSSFADKGGRSVLHQAALNGNDSIVKILLAKGVNPLARDHNMQSALHQAALGGHESVVQRLIDNGVDCSFQDTVGRSALHEAALNGHDFIAKLLLLNGAKVMDLDADGCSALHHAAEGGHDSVVELLLSEGADASALDNNKRSSLHEAATGGHELVVKLLLLERANVSDVDIDGCSALHEAAKGGHESIAKLLLAERANPLVPDNNGRSALHEAAEGGHELVVELLLSNGVSPSVLDINGSSALHLASGGGYESVVKLLLSEGAKLSDVDIDGCSALHLAAEGGHDSVVELLLSEGADASALDNNKRASLHEAAKGGHESVVKLLLSEGANISDVDIDGCSALHLAAEGGHDSVVELLLSEEADASALDNNKRSSLHEAATGGHESVVKLLLSEGANISDVDIDGCSALHEAAKGGHESVARLLLKHGAPYSNMNDDNRTPLLEAAFNDHEPIIRLLLQKDVNISGQDLLGRTPLHWAAYHSNITAAHLLLHSGADRSILDNKNFTPQQLAESYTVKQATTRFHCSQRDMDPSGGVTILLPKGPTVVTTASHHEDMIRMLREWGSNPEWSAQGQALVVEPSFEMMIAEEREIIANSGIDSEGNKRARPTIEETTNSTYKRPRVEYGAVYF